MIRFENLTKTFRINGHTKVVIDDLSLTLPSGRSIALLGRNGAGKSTLLEIVAGNLRPDRGRVVSDGTISFPVGLASAFHKDLSAAENVRFVARIYGVDTTELVAFVEDFAELGESFYMPVRTYSSGMKARLAFGASMGMHFDTYLVDEVTAVGDPKFKRKSKAVFAERVKNSSAVFVSHSIPQLRQYCDCGIVLEKGRARFFEDLEEAIELHNANTS
ncbi:ATP-binding cassette domain-containing protein [Roseovarius salis]|uniref:ABC transporter ATP-binding protein n=1 Tax=Roseovarius salis TaxID=3376063 RepID=UPI0037CA283F